MLTAVTTTLTTNGVRESRIARKARSCTWNAENGTSPTPNPASTAPMSRAPPSSDVAVREDDGCEQRAQRDELRR